MSEMHQCETHLRMVIWNTPAGWLGRIEDDGDEIARISKHLTDAGDAFDDVWRLYDKLMDRMGYPQDCPECEGTGLGMHSDSNCMFCNGSGMIKRKRVSIE